LKLTVSRLLRLPLIAMFILAFMLLPADLMASLCFNADAATFKILDAAKYHDQDNSCITSLEIEIIDSNYNDFFSHGQHFGVWVTLSPDSGIKIGQTLQADLSGYNTILEKDVRLDPNTVVIIDDNPSCFEIPWSVWDPFIKYLRAIKIAFILFWWIVVILLVSKKSNVVS